MLGRTAALLAGTLVTLSAPLPAQVVRGTILDHPTRAPVAGATVELADSAGVVRATATSDSLGAFAMVTMEGGRYTLRATRVGYLPVGSALEVAAGETVGVELLLAAAPIELEPLRVAYRTTYDSPVVQEFWKRRARGRGVFITREELDRMPGARLTDVIAALPGVDVRGSNAIGPRTIHMRRHAGTPNCPVQLFVDGRSYASGGESLDLFNTSDVEGVEVYRGLSETPPEYGGIDSRCGVVAIWTRRAAAPGQAESGERDGRSKTARFFLALGLLAGGFLLAR